MVDSISSAFNNITSTPQYRAQGETMTTEDFQNLLKTLFSLLQDQQGDAGYRDENKQLQNSFSEFMNSYFPADGQALGEYLTTDLNPSERRELGNSLDNIPSTDTEALFEQLNSNNRSEQRSALENLNADTDGAAAGFSHLPPTSIVRQFTDGLFGANKRAQDKVESKMSILDQANKLSQSNDKEAIKAFLREHGYNLPNLDDMTLEQLQESLDGFSETMQIKLQQDMAILQITFQTISSIVDNLKQATGKAAGAIGS